MTNYPDSSFVNFSLNYARELKLGGKISREDYWKIVRSKLELLTEIQSVLNREDLVLIVTPFEMQLEIPLLGFDSKINMILDADDIRSVPFSVLADGPYEKFQGKILMALASVSKEFLDIGANMGYYSLAASKINPKITVQSFEPQPKVFSTLLRNLSLNNLSDRINAHNYGLGVSESRMTMFIPRFTGTGGASFANLHENEGLPQEVEVEVKMLDSYLEEYSHPDLIKIDVEGYEFEVISGGMGIIMKSKPTIIAELLRKWMKPFDRQPQEVVDVLAEVGYIMYAISENKLINIDKINDDTPETNFIFVHSSNAKHLETIGKFL